MTRYLRKVINGGQGLSHWGGKEVRGRYLEGENSPSTAWLFGDNSRESYVLIYKMQGREARGMGRVSRF